MKIYLAYPITGLQFEDVVAYYTDMQSSLTDLGYTVLHPMTAKGELRTEKGPFVSNGYTLPQSSNHAIFERDMWMIRQADVVHFNFEPTTKVSIGMVAELAYASGMGKHTVVALPEQNPHYHAFVLEAADVVFPNFDASYNYLARLVHGAV